MEARRGGRAALRAGPGAVPFAGRSKVLWLAAVVAVGGYMVLAMRSGGLDYWTFWAAGRAVSAGLDPYAVGILRSVAPPRQPPGLPRVMPFYGPPFFATLMGPLSALPYRASLGVWTLVNLGAGVLVTVAVCSALPHPGDSRNWAAVALAVAVSPPLLATIALGETDLIVAGCIAGSWLLARRSSFASGLCLCGALIDPHLATGFVLYYLAKAIRHRDGWLAGGMAAGGAVLGALSAAHLELCLIWLRHALPAAAACAGCLGQITVAHLVAAWGPAGRARPIALALVDVAACGAAMWRWLRGGPSETESFGLAALLTMLCTLFALNQDELVLVFAVPAVAHGLGGLDRRWAASAAAGLGAALAAGLTLAAVPQAPRLAAMGLLPLLAVFMWPRRTAGAAGPTAIVVTAAAVWIVGVSRGAEWGLVGGPATAAMVLAACIAGGALVWQSGSRALAGRAQGA